MSSRITITTAAMPHMGKLWRPSENSPNIKYASFLDY
jgi:hypothetical protein